MPYQYSDSHTSADIGLVSSGSSPTEMLIDAALGLTALMVEPDDLRGDRSFEIDIAGDDPESLFYRWLSEIIFLKDAENFLLKNCAIKCEDTPTWKVTGRLYGDNIDPSRQRLKIDIKAVTLYKLSVARIGDIWRGEVVLDL
ncbi:MAG: archease [Candidatus Zixiibacteriota bacterium]